MTNHEAKFILGAYRPGGRDATDPLFVELLAQARSDPGLKAWFTAQLAFDASVASRLRAVQPPHGLRDTILAGARVSRRQRSRRRRWPWFAAATAILMLLSGIAVVRSSPGRPELAELARFALHDTAFDGREHVGSIPAIRAIEERLANATFRSGLPVDLDLGHLRANGCRTVRVAGREVFEICFGHEHEFHVYIARRDQLRRTPLARTAVQGPRRPLRGDLGGFAIRVFAGDGGGSDSAAGAVLRARAAAPVMENFRNRPADHSSGLMSFSNVSGSA